MPLYEYQCEDCGERFERIRKFSDPPLDERCSKCGGPVRKLISSPAIQFKGKGWYVTDYAKSGAEPSKADSATSEASADAKSDAKKEKKAEGAPSSAEGKTESKTEAPKPAPAAPAKAEKTAEKK